jgi:hypothetical protein
MKLVRRMKLGFGLLAVIAALDGAALTGCGEDGAPAVPHTLSGRSDCLSCHGTGAGGAPQVPASHSGRTNDMCLNCHG